MTLAIEKIASSNPGPGRPKDLEKRAAILNAAKLLFPKLGFEGTSMDAIAAQAGVSKLTVYNHFNDKDTLFVEAVKEKCEQQMPAELFDVAPQGPIRNNLMIIAHSFFELITSHESIGLMRMMAAEGREGGSKLATLFWEAGPKRTVAAFEVFLRHATEVGLLDVSDPHRTAGHFFCLLKGEIHMRLMVGCSEPYGPVEAEHHVQSVVEMFLRAYEPR
jgi:TetR/AcrR family transcriptional regulator, mexJK operon transcriptional repressor